MARGKQAEQELTPEEKLQQALVPAEEQPYAVPGNWCWVYLTSGAAECKDAFRKPINATERASRVGDIPYYGATGQVGWIDDYLTNEQLVLVGEDGAPFLDFTKDKAYLIEGKAWVNNHAHILKSFYGTTGNIYLLHYLNVFNYKEFVNGTTRLKLTQASMDTIPVPIAPLSEQHRIVARIESLFAKLDEAKEKAQTVVDGFELRKSAIMHQAFTGELIGISGGKTTPLESIVKTIRIGPFGSALHKEDYISGGIPIVNPKHIVNQQIVFEEKATITEEKASELMAYRLKTGDIVMGRRGEMGRSAPVTEKENGWLCGTGSLIIRLQDGYNSVFYSQIIASHSSVQYLEENCVGSTMKNLNEKVIRSLPVPIYTKEQQDTIVAALNSLLEKEQQAKEAAEAVLAQIDTIKKAVLARAFRGELGTNDPAEESAEQLLRAAFE